MARPRVRFDDKGQPLPCKVFIPPHLARFLYREALNAREGNGVQVEETDIVIRLVEEWAASKPEMEWPETLAGLQAEVNAADKANVPRERGSGRKKGKPKSEE